MNPLILVNAAHPCPAEVPELVPLLGGPVLLEREAARALEALMAEVDGWRSIVPVSGWRSREEQAALYQTSLAEHGPEFTRRFVARPGYSEHHTGLAIDLGLRGAEPDLICPDFPHTGICRRVRERAADFGFVERYPQGREAVTGIAYEPWHFRYVGPLHAREMADRGLTLEEYLV